jgi:NAD(P)-dependent dehydrogenase (short-subunit alcohol dehydrogenase family)
MILKNKVAVVYGAGGAVGGAVARAFANEGAKVFLTGRRIGPVEAVTKEIVSAGGTADAAKVDALDERAIDEHLRFVVDKAGRIDISFNAIGLPDKEIVGSPLVEIDVEKFLLPIVSYTRSYLLTARLAAKRMLPNKSGVIMTVSALMARAGAPAVGGYSPAMAGKEAITRALSFELASQGIRVVGLRPHAMPETESIREVFEAKAAKAMTWEQWQAYAASNTHTKRLMSLAEVGNVAAFMASDRASGMTGTTVNLTMGNLDD